MNAAIWLVLSILTSSAYAIGYGEPVDKKSQLANTVVAIYYHSGAINEACTGSVISPRHILTAAHCFINRKTHIGRDEKKFSVLLGVDVGGIMFGIVPKDVKSFDIESVEFNNKNIEFGVPGDIAIIKLKKDLPRRFTPVTLATEETQAIQESDELVTIGYGLTSAGSSALHSTTLNSGVFKKTPIPMNDMNEFFQSGNSSFFIHMNSKNGQSICSGDSGGPTFRKINEKLVQIGVTHGSTNKAGAHLGRCPNEESYITNVAPFSKWITDTIKK